jgi:hypothetical protein
MLAVVPMFYRVVSQTGAVLLGLTLLYPALPRSAGAAPDPDSGAALANLTQNLQLEIVETGPDQLWTLHLSNAGASPIGVMADPGLLWFDISVPGQTTPQTCRLPEPLWPTGMRRRAQMVLAPGERFSRRFDPRFFCFADLDQRLLVPGARVTPHFGWPVQAQQPAPKAQRQTSAPSVAAPFVAWPIAAGTPAAAPAESSQELTEPSAEAQEAEALARLPTEGIKHVVGASIELSTAYARWSQATPRDMSQSLQLVMLAGSDAEDERNVTITVGLSNPTGVPQQVVARRDLLDYEVRGPDGVFECPPGEAGPPDYPSFSTLPPQSTERFVVRLLEMCPRGGFARPGLYEVYVRLHAKWSGVELGLDAFMGTLTADRPAMVRVRSGDRSSFLRAPLVLATGAGGEQEAPRRRTRGGEPGADAPADGSQESPAQDEAPADHDGTGAPDEAPPPAPPAPGNGTVIE